MKNLFQWLCAMGAFVLLAGPAMAADAIAAGKIKAVNAEKKELVLTDSEGKDWTIKLGDNVVINRGGKESQSDLNAGDPVNVCYDKGLLTWTAHYILVQEGNTKDCELVHGSVKNYDVDKKQLTLTDHRGKNWTFPMGDAKVRLNREDSKIQDIKIGDSALAIVEKRTPANKLPDLGLQCPSSSEGFSQGGQGVCPIRTGGRSRAAAGA